MPEVYFFQLPQYSYRDRLRFVWDIIHGLYCEQCGCKNGLFLIYKFLHVKTIFFLHVKTISISLIIIVIILHSTAQLYNFNKAGHIYICTHIHKVGHIYRPSMAFVTALGLFFLSPLPFLWRFNLPSAVPLSSACAQHRGNEG